MGNLNLYKLFTLKMFRKAITLVLLLSVVCTQAAKRHYGNPARGSCRSDELPAQIQGMNGDVCMPRCTNNSCPTDLPDSQTTATPACMVQDMQGNKYCVLQCSGSAKRCPIGATCQIQQWLKPKTTESCKLCLVFACTQSKLQ